MDTVLRLTRGEVLYWSAVVAEELYAGSKDKRFIWQMDKIYYRFQKAGRLVIPNHQDWRTAGIALSQIGKRYGFDKIRRGVLVNDALIAASCRREGILLLTLNEKDFRMLKREIPLNYRTAFY